MSNRLAAATSPYLLQHADNPVHWQPWDDAALEQARVEDRPILLSIGYAACHWCHVMERESFENDAIAKLMNEHFVCIKVDREERPDLDDIYMAATVAMHGSGGWPMTVFLTPAQEPFFAGTYFPPEDKYGRPGFPSVLQRIADMWATERETLSEQASSLIEHLNATNRSAAPQALDDTVLRTAVSQLESAFDPDYGGFSGAPKFPPTASIRLLLHYDVAENSDVAKRMATTTLTAMKNGGIYDQLRGGFARYSTDARWHVPHFEKMLYDNALLARAYLEGYQATGDSEYARVAAETLDYIVAEMQSPEGGYYSATDADSEGVEGKYFVWSHDEVQEVLDAETAAAAAAYFDIAPQGNWEGTNVLHTPRSRDDVAAELGIGLETLNGRLTAAKAQLLEVRKQRTAPALDDKILTSWNGLMIGAMAEGYRVLGDRGHLDSALRAAEFISTRLRGDDDGLLRTYRQGNAHTQGYLDDYAYLADGLIDLYEAGGARPHLDRAHDLAQKLLDDFRSPSGSFFQSSSSHEPLIVRHHSGQDSALPSANAIAARALARLSLHFDNAALRTHAVRALKAYGQQIERSPRAHAASLLTMLQLMQSATELAFTGESGRAELERAVAKHYLPFRFIQHDDGNRREGLALLTDKPTADPARLFVCRNFTCNAPVTDPAEVESALAAHARSQPTGAVAVTAGVLTGRATPEGTQRYAARFQRRFGDHGYRNLGVTDLKASRFGFGGYRIDDRDPEHRAALSDALLSGVNLIDTSTNYTGGASERVVGRVLRECVDDQHLQRDEIILVSKIGYVQESNLTIARDREQRKRPFDDMVRCADDLWHCIHPDWLRDQLSRSLARLEVETLDACLLHNPEYFLSDARKRGVPTSEARSEFYRRIGAAFEHLEREVRDGRIAFYGVSSNSCTLDPDDPEATSLDHFLRVAKRIASQHHFRILQLPFNLLEQDATRQLNNPESPEPIHSALEHAAANDVAVLVNRPLNAITDRGLRRLADPQPVTGAPPFEAALSRVERLEREYRTNIGTHLRSAKGRPSPEGFFRWADQLGRLPARLDGIEQWRDIEQHTVRAHLRQASGLLDRGLKGEMRDRWNDWQDRYRPALDRLLLALNARAAERSATRSEKLNTLLDPTLDDDERPMPLSHKALNTLCATPGVSTVLVGMRRRTYVDDVLGAMEKPPLKGATRVLDAALKADIR